MEVSRALILLSNRLISFLSVTRFLSIMRNGVSRGELICEFTWDVCAVRVMAEAPHVLAPMFLGTPIKA